MCTGTVKKGKSKRKSCRRHCILRKGRKIKTRGKKNCALKRKKWPERQQKEKQLVEKEVSKTKRETSKLQVREKRKLRDSKESHKKRPRVNSPVFTDFWCVCFGSYQEDTGQKGNGYSANVNGGSMKSALIMMTPIQSDAFCPSCWFSPYYFSYVNIFCTMQ